MEKEKQITFSNFNQPANVGIIANQIRQHVEARKLTVVIGKKRYPKVEAWQYAGALIGLFPRVVTCENVSDDKEIKYRAEVEILNSATNQIISRAFAYCSNKEGSKRRFDEYSIASMAQTRAVGKAFRVLLAWILQASGYEATPAEEMTEVSDDTGVVNEYKSIFLSALDLCTDTITLAKLCKAATAFYKDPDVIAKATKLHHQFKNNQNGK